MSINANKPLSHAVPRRLIVRSIQPAAESFNKSEANGGGKVYCHFIEGQITEAGPNEADGANFIGRLIKMQICLPHKEFNDFIVGDIIEYITNKYVPAKDRYTASSYRLVEQGDGARPDQPMSDKVPLPSAEQQEQPAHRDSTRPSGEPAYPSFKQWAMAQSCNSAALMLQMKPFETNEERMKEFDELADSIYAKIITAD